MTTHDLYKTVSNAIVTALEAGDLSPWKCPWSRTGAGFPLRYSGVPYKGVNVLWLWLTCRTKGYASPYFLTFKQALAEGGSVRRGEKSTPVLFCQPQTKDVTNPDGSEGKDSYWITRSYNVFNAEQIDGLDKCRTPETAMLDEDQRIAEADTYFKNTGADIRHEGASAFYRPITDAITMPRFETFTTALDYYATLAHEAIHWTGAPTRLSRFGLEKQKAEDYAREEIVAELASCFLTAQLGIEPMPDANHASYLEHWICAIRSDSRYIFTAASKAQQAADYLNRLQPEA